MWTRVLVVLTTYPYASANGLNVRRESSGLEISTKAPGGNCVLGGCVSDLSEGSGFQGGLKRDCNMVAGSGEFQGSCGQR